MSTVSQDNVIMHNLRPLLRPEEAAKVLKVSMRAFWRLIAGGQLKKIKVGHLTRIDECDLIAFIESNRIGGVK